MAKDPAVLLYTQDFLVGTMTFTDAQTGQYIKLLCMQHQVGPMTKQMMEQVVRGNIDKDVFAKFEDVGGGKYANKRMLEETKKRQSFTESRRANAKHKQEHMQQHMLKHMDNHMENENEDEDLNANGDKKFGKSNVVLRRDVILKSAKAIKLPESLEAIEGFLPVWHSWLDHLASCEDKNADRKLSAPALDIVLGELTKSSDPLRLVKETLRRGKIVMFTDAELEKKKSHSEELHSWYKQ